MRCLEVHEPLASDELTLSVKLENMIWKLLHYSNRFGKVDLFIDDKELSTITGNGAIFTCDGISFTVIMDKKINFFI